MRKADYGRIADTYDASRPLFEEVLELWITIISERVGPRQRVEFLDLGCGTGRFSIPIATRLGYSVTGADNSEEMLEKARNKEDGDRVRWSMQDATRLSCPNASFDVVFMSHLLHHLDEPLDVVGECIRVLRPGGVILNRYGPMEDIRDDPEHRFFPGSVEIDEARTPTVKQVEEWFRVAGFNDISTDVIAQQTYRTAEERLRNAGLRCTSVLTLLDQPAVEEGLEAFRRYVSDNPDDPWLLMDNIALTAGRKTEKMVIENADRS
ncbi:MAG: class I SAM-dependent methyltransferase [Methanomassiliicoccales archaeon]|nr:MAG: class I SAM-dependent methyltransferase [Methanomassiliicoccales archaeon]